MSDFIINKTIRITSLFNSEENISGRISPTIRYNIYCPVDTQIPVMGGTLVGTDRYTVQCKAQNGCIIHGEIISELNAEEMVLGGNLFYGLSNNQALQNHFDGTIAIYALQPLPVPPVPPGPIGNTTDFSGNMAIDAALFPYLYIQPWPTETPAGAELQFIQYDTTAAAADSLYGQLSACVKNNEGRMAMETLATNFISGTGTFSAPYFGDLMNIPQPFTAFPALYDLLEMIDTTKNSETILLTWLSLESTVDIPSLITPENEAVVDQVWQSYFALTIITGYQDLFLKNLNKIILVWNILEKLASDYLPEQDIQEYVQSLLQASIILPGSPAVTPSVFPLPPYQTPPAPDADSWIEPYAIGQLKITRYHLLGYQQGEVAQIQNILKGEKKKVVSRTLVQDVEQNIQHNNDDKESHNESSQSTQELLLEIQKTVAEFTKKTVYNGLTTTYGPPTQAILGGDYSDIITSQKPGKDDTSSFATRVVSKTLSRINESVLRSRVTSRYSEREETASSIFDNFSGDRHFRGIYRWVNKEYRISVHNYGHRFLLQLRIDTPAANFIAEQETLNDIDLKKPLSPAQKKIKGYTDIDVHNYVELLNYYQVDKPLLPPAPEITTSVSVNAEESEKNISIPEGYVASSATVTAQIAAGSSLASVTGIIGATAFSVASGASVTGIQLQQESFQLPVSLIGSNATQGPPADPEYFILNAVVTCAVSEQKMQEWQMLVYAEIRAAYLKMIADYNGHLTRFSRNNQQPDLFLINSIERSCLYKNCSDMLLDIAVAKVGNPTGTTPSVLAVNEQRYRQFIKETFEWDEMTYMLDENHSALSDTTPENNGSLRPFLQASTATVFLPVKPDHNFRALYYLTAGGIWMNSYPFIPVNDTDTSIAAHLKKVIRWNEQPREEKYWNIMLPTSMQVIQPDDRLPYYSSAK